MCEVNHEEDKDGIFSLTAAIPKMSLLGYDNFACILDVTFNELKYVYYFYDGGWFSAFTL